MKLLFLAFTLVLSSNEAIASSRIYLCQVIKKVSIDSTGHVHEYPRNSFIFRDESGDYSIVEKGKPAIVLGNSIGFPNRLDNLKLVPHTYYDEDFWRGYHESEALHYFFKGNILYLMTSTSNGALTIVSTCLRGID
jgi:hypothetical protein